MKKAEAERSALKQNVDPVRANLSEATRPCQLEFLALDFEGRADCFGDVNKTSLGRAQSSPFDASVPPTEDTRPFCVAFGGRRLVGLSGRAAAWTATRNGLEFTEETYWRRRKQTAPQGA